MSLQPQSFVPRCPADFIGPAAKLAAVLERKALLARVSGEASKLLIVGQPGIGKTRLAEMFAGLVAGHSTQIETVIGRNVDAATVRRWQEESHYRALHGAFAVKVLNELDTIPAVAQDVLLAYLDDLPNNRAVIATSNQRLDQLSERFQSRFQQFRLAPPSEGEIAALLETLGCNGQSAGIARAVKGNVRAAILDAQSAIDCAALTN